MMPLGRTLAAAGLSLLCAAPCAAARTPPPHLTGLRCVPATSASCASGVTVTIGRLVQVRGSALRPGYRASFRWSTGAIASQLRTSRAGLVARVPTGVKVGTVSLSVSDRAHRRSNVLRLRIVSSGPAPVKAAPVGDLPAAFAGPGMWIWELPKSDGGDLTRIIARAQAAHMQTLYVKAADGSDTWRQFTPQLIAALHAADLRVCAWQFVYGANPSSEAAAAAAAVSRGADCFVIDAESAYEGRYAAASKYMDALRTDVGADFPIALTSFPYVDYHPRLPFSVFLGPGGAQANLPQVYWKAIGTSVDSASAHTFSQNRLYGRPIAPLGQTYEAASGSDLRRFESVWSAYGAGGESWWDWQETSGSQWDVLGQTPPDPPSLPDPGWPSLGSGSRGDQVIWLQEHLKALDPSIAIDGRLGPKVVAAVKAFQVAHGMPATGRTDPTTWQELLTVAPVVVDWTTRAAPRAAAARAARAPEIPQLGRGG